MMSDRILIIEDEPTILEMIICALEMESFQVEGALTGEEGLRILEENAQDLIILDVGLPDESGFEVCKKVRTHPLNLMTPIIFLTARNSEIDKVVGLEIGGDDYLTKPFSPRELSARVKAILRRTKNRESFHEHIKKEHDLFRVDEKKKMIHLKNSKLDLTRYEYLLLKCLINSPGQVFSRDQLMEKIWDDPGSSLDRTIDAHIKSIRNKCKNIISTDPIETHRGLGYSLKEEIN